MHKIYHISLNANRLYTSLSLYPLRDNIKMKKLYNLNINGFIESEKYQEMIAVTESPPKGSGTFRLDDDTEFPPVTQRTD